MAKRDTSGRPRKQRSIEQRPLSKSERDRIWQQRMLIGAGVLGGVVVLLLILGVFNETVIKPGQTITTVNGVEIETRDFQRRVRAERWLQITQLRELYEEGAIGYDSVEQQIAILDRQPENIGSQVLDDMELQILLEEEAQRRGVQIDEAAVQAQVDDYITAFTNVSLTQTPTATSTPLPRASLTPFITATPSETPTITPTASDTPLPTVENCAEGEDCATVTPLPSPTITETPAETSTPTSTATPISQDEIRSTQENYESGLYEGIEDDADVDRELLTEIFRYQALRVALREAVTDELIEEGEIETSSYAVTSRHILIGVPEDLQAAGYSASLCDSEDWLPYRLDALSVLELLESGAPFPSVAQSFSDDPGSGANGGMLGFTPNVDNSQFVDQFKDALKAAEVGEYYGPVCTQFGFHIIQVLEKEENPLSESELNNRRQDAYREWEIDLTIGADIQRRGDWEDRIPDKPEAEEMLSDIIDENS